MEYQYEVVEHGRYEQSTIYRGSSLEYALQDYQGYSGCLTLYRTDGTTWEWLCMDGETFLPC